MSAPNLVPGARRPDWGTPQPLFERYDAEFHFTLDAAASAENAKCARYFTERDDGLTRDWGTETVWLNPPYGAALTPWMRKAYWAAETGATVVCLVPAATDLMWWHVYAQRGEIRFIRGRVRFVGAINAAPFASAIVVFRPPVTHAEVSA